MHELWFIILFCESLEVLEHNLDWYWKFYPTVDNGTREGLDKFLKAASSEPETVLHYEFMQDYKVCAENPFWIEDIIKNHLVAIGAHTSLARRDSECEATA